MRTSARENRDSLPETSAHQFLSVSGGPVSVRYHPAIDPLLATLFRVACAQQVEIVEATLRSRIRPWRVYPGRLRVYAYPTPADVSRVYGRPISGYANWNDWYIAINLEADWGELLRHELAHIVAGWWNPRPAAVLCEGLAVWAQKTWDGRSLDDCVRAAHASPESALDLLLGRPPWSVPQDLYWYYVMAGGLTGAVIRRFGWGTYRRLYGDGRINRGNLPRYFRRHIRADLGAVVREWLAGVADRPPMRLVHPRLA
jgi:hypothetical protein